MTIDAALLSLLSAILGGLIVAAINHVFSRRRELDAKKRDIALSKLLEAWLALDAASHKPGVYDGEIHKLEEATRLILLFAEDDDIDKIETITKNVTKKEPADYTPLLKSLRQKIRDQIGLEGRARHFWFAAKPIQTPTPKDHKKDNRHLDQIG
ncbi:MAG TPA: hypothetical protein PLQ11_10715 [Beijerinckiaceae bacterium]|nr:hypothetical protein [Beijerinckiaceae bacterium]